MKIVDVKAIPCNRFLFVEIETDNGIVGLGESGTWAFLDASREVVETYKNYLIGQDPLRIEHHFQYMYRSYHFRGAAIMGAISAIDIALWDIKGKYYNTPVYNLLGGKTRDKARVYYHVGGDSIEAMVENLKDAKKKGFTAVGHLSPFLDEPRSQVYEETYCQRIERAIDRVKTYRETVGNDVDLCIEVHRRLAPQDAITFAKGIEKYKPYFLEDPTTPDNFDNMAYISSHVDVPIATGERFHTPQEFAMLAKRGGIQYFRPDVCLCGGITGAKKIAAIAEAYNITVVPHNPLSPVSTAACLQIAACIPNFGLLEFPGDDRPCCTDRYISHQIENDKESFAQRDVVKATYKYENGYIFVPDTPGIGVELADNVEKRFPYSRREVVTRLHADGSVVDQ